MIYVMEYILGCKKVFFIEYKEVFLLCVQEVVTHLYNKLLYKIGHHFLDILYIANFPYLFLSVPLSVC